jgi:hypothetical protein
VLRAKLVPNDPVAASKPLAASAPQDDYGLRGRVTDLALGSRDHHRAGRELRVRDSLDGPDRGYQADPDPANPLGTVGQHQASMPRSSHPRGTPRQTVSNRPPFTNRQASGRRTASSISDQKRQWRPSDLGRRRNSGAPQGGGLCALPGQSAVLDPEVLFAVDGTIVLAVNFDEIEGIGDDIGA